MSPFNIINRLPATSCTPTRPTTRIHKASTPFPGAACPFGISSVLRTAASSINTSTSSSPKKTQDIQIIQEKSLLKFAEPHGSHREPIQADQPEQADQPQGPERAQAQPDREQIMFRNPVSSVICWPTPRLFALAHLLQLLEAQHLICTSSYASPSECFHLCMQISAANASWSPPLCLTMHPGDFTIDTIDINWMLNFNKLVLQSRNFRRQNTRGQQLCQSGHQSKTSETIIVDEGQSETAHTFR